MNLSDERLGQLLKLVRGDMSFPSDRSLPPVITPMYTPYSLEDFAKRNSAELTYEELDAVVEGGYIQLHPGRMGGWLTRVSITTEGNRLALDLTGFDWKAWQGRHSSKICCELARPRTCVCEVSVACETHGTKCHGTHD
jgi:hypothetical protein